MKNSTRGHIALTTVLIISSLLTLMIINASAMGIVTQNGLLHQEYKRQSRELAYACGNIAVAKMIHDPSYQPPPAGEVVSLENDSCTILTISNTSGVRTIKASGAYQTITTTLEMEL